MPGFRQALESDGGLTTARRILSLPIASCVLELRDRGLPHLTVEGFIALNPRYHPLLTKAELNTCLVRYEVAKGRVK